MTVKKLGKNKATGKAKAAKHGPGEPTVAQLQSIEALALMNKKFRLAFFADPRGAVLSQFNLLLNDQQVKVVKKKGQGPLDAYAECIKECFGDPGGDFVITLWH